MDRGQMILFGTAALFIAFQAFRGWRLGVVRQLIQLVALVAAYVSGFFFAGLALPLLRLTGFADVILQPLSMALVGVVAYVGISFIGRVLFKKTTDQDFGFVWFIYGISGAFLGALFGLFFVTVAALALRFVGTLALEVEPKRGEIAGAPANGRQTAISKLVEIKHTLDTGAAGEVLDTVDPIPKKAYELTGKLGRMAKSPDAIRRFAAYPGVESLTRRPEIIALKDDPEIIKAVREGQYLSLLRNPRITKTANNPKFVEAVKSLEIEKALDFALEAEQSSPASRER